MKQRTGLSQVLSKLSEQREGGRFCPLQLADFRICGDTNKEVARVTIVTDNRDYSEEELSAAFLDAMDTRSRLLPQSIARTGGLQNGKRFYTALAKLNLVSLPYEDNVEKMTCIASSTFLDDKNQVWRVEGDGDNRRLYINTEDDMAAIFAARRQHYMLPETATSYDVPNGKYCMYYSVTAGKYAFGVGFNTARGLVIVDRMKENAATIDPALVVIAETFDVSKADDSLSGIRYENPLGEVAAAASSKLIEYYRKIFKNTAFFVKLESAIRQAAK